MYYIVNSATNERLCYRDGGGLIYASEELAKNKADIATEMTGQRHYALSIVAHCVGALGRCTAPWLQPAANRCHAVAVSSFVG